MKRRRRKNLLTLARSRANPLHAKPGIVRSVHLRRFAFPLDVEITLAVEKKTTITIEVVKDTELTPSADKDVTVSMGVQ